MTDIPLATILRINAARTIPLTRYEEEGNFDRFGYIKDLAENHGADLPAVIEIADLLGPEEVRTPGIKGATDRPGSPD